MNALLPIPTQTAVPHDRSADVVTRLQQSELFRDYQDAFQTATGLPLVLRAVDSFQPPLHGSKRMASFCALMEGANKTCAACLQLQARTQEAPTSQSTTLQCFAGLSESIVPVLMGENVIAYLQTGQIFLRTPTEKDFRAVMTELEKWKTLIDLNDLHTAFFETRVLSKARYGAVLRLISSFAHHLSLVANELMIQTTSAEPPTIVKARAFIAENLGEVLSLERVAHAANMSSFYFCKTFKVSTGLTFTDYVGRARIEQTKQLLLNPQVRISEAAFEAGFQSLSQFNRVFQRVQGQSPSSYREHLKASNTEARPRTRLMHAA